MAIRRKIVISICSKKRKGLIDHSNALKAYGQLYDGEREYYAPLELGEYPPLLRKIVHDKSDVICIVWDNSLSSLSKMVFLRMLRVKCIYYLHEPGGIGQKLTKGDPFFYSHLAAVVEYLYQKLSHYTAVPRFQRISYGDFVLPLLFSSARLPEEKTRNIIGYIGGKRKSRLYHVLMKMRKKLEYQKIFIEEFPSKNNGKSEKEKILFLSRCSVVWNVYGVPYNQSGVTGDCIMSGTEIFVSHFEPQMKTLDALGLVNIIDLDTEEGIFNTIVSFFNKRKEMNTKKDAGSEIKSNFGGKNAFQKFWIEAFVAIENEDIEC